MPCNSGTCPQPDFAMKTTNEFAPTLQTSERLWDADIMNTYSYMDWRDFLLNLAMTRFEWINVPDTIDPRYIEWVLLTQGWGCFFESSPGYLTFCQATQVDNLDMYFNPQTVQMVPANGNSLGSPWTRECQERVTPTSDGGLRIVEKSAVACFDSMLRAPLMYRIELAARRLAKIDRVIDVNVCAQMTPWVGVAKEEARLDLERYMNQIIGAESVVLTDEGFATDVTATTIPTTSPFVADSLQNCQDRLLNRRLTMLGIDNAFSQKKEREVASEMDANNEQIYITRETALRCRQKACKEVNELFHTNMDVRFATKLNDEGGVDFGDEVIMNEQGIQPIVSH